MISAKSLKILGAFTLVLSMGTARADEHNIPAFRMSELFLKDACNQYWVRRR
jgi:hypothetical protein